MASFDVEQTARLLALLEQLLAIEETGREEVLQRAALLIAQALMTEKADVFLFEPETQTLIAQGISATPLGHLQHAVGLHRLALANGGRAVGVFQTGEFYRSGQVQDDPTELPGIKQTLKVRSVMAAPLEVGGERRGLIQVDSTRSDAFDQQDEDFLKAVTLWVGIVTHRAELIQQVRQTAAEEARRLTAQEMMTILAHDLRNDLTPIKGRLELLKRRAVHAQQEHELRELTTILAGLRRFEHLITDVMDLTRLTHGLFTLTCQPVDLAFLVQDAVAATRTPSAAISVQVAADLVIWADASRLQQALENVLANAIKHSPQGTPVQVRAEVQDPPTTVVLSIKDAGPGIPPAILPHLFEPFQAGKESTGLGLGLYLAYQIALAHGGNLAVETKPHQGTSFLFSLPVADPQER